MSNKKQKYVGKLFEDDPSYQGKHVSANIFESMIMSKAWNELTKGQRLLYVYCKAQLYSQRPSDKEGMDEEYRTRNVYFTMNRAKYEKMYGLYKNNTRSFRKDMIALVEKGFIDVVFSGFTVKKKSLYKLSDRWILYGESDYEQPDAMSMAFIKGRSDME